MLWGCEPPTTTTPVPEETTTTPIPRKTTTTEQRAGR